MFNKAHAAVMRPATLIVVSNNIVVSWTRVGTEIPLDKVTRFICDEAQEDMEPVHIVRIEMDRMTCFGSRVAELKGIIWHLWPFSHLVSPLQAQNEDIEHEDGILEDKGRKLEPVNHDIRIRMCHVLVSTDSIVLRSEGRFRICGLDPCGEKATFICLEEQKLAKVDIHDLLDWLDAIAGNKFVVCVEKLTASFLKRPLG
jgi:hypothetical protein